jgi:chemotaxis protein MotA
MKFPLGHFFTAFKVAMKAFFNKAENPRKLIQEGIELANIARKEGVLGLEGRDIDNEFLKRGIQLCVDGHEPEFVRSMLGKDINMTIDRHERGQAIFKSIGDVAPAMGMIGTLIGLVQMLGNLEDPSAIGPGMAVALLTTFYGAILANMVLSPLASKLERNIADEELVANVSKVAAESICRTDNPRRLELLLNAMLPPSKQINYFS